MVEALDMLELIALSRDPKGKIIIPDDVENLFSLIDFAHDKTINENEFLKATMHYRKLAKMLTIHLLEDCRKHVSIKFIVILIKATRLQ